MENRFTTVISGISGKFPDCESVTEFSSKLYSGKSFMSLAPDRWPINYRYKYTDIVLPPATGKFKLLKEFDPVVFRMNKITAECTDAITRKILEPSFEAVMDAGLNPYDLDGRNIGVFMAYSHSDSESRAISDSCEGRLYVLGASKTMMPNRVSFALNLRGPSFTFGNDIFGNLSALNEAYDSVSKGRVEAAIVGICTCVQHPMLSVNLTKMNVLSPDSETRVFDKNANGYGRSDGLVTLFIQRADDAKRNYATIDFSGFTYFGSNPNSYFNFDENLLRDAIDDLYKRKNYETTDDISFIEMSACGLKMYDKIESNFIADTLCKNRKNPLLVGSVKSNVGMTDSTGPYVSVIKAILALESGIIAPNQNLNEINDQIKAFAENKLEVVTKPTPLLSDKIVVNSVGITGALSQVILKQNSKKMLENTSSADDLPRLVLACARTEVGMENLLKKLEQINFNVEFISMVNDVFCKDMPYHIFRGYSIVSSDITYQKKNSFDVKGNKTRPVWFLFSGMGSQWNGMGEGLLKIPIIAETVKKCDEVLQRVGVDIYHILTTTDPTIFDNIMHSFVGIITIQIALVEVLKALGIKPDGIIGHSVGENACAYADGCLTLEQAVLSSYARGMASIQTKTIRGMMAAVGKGYNQIKNDLPESIEVACHNSATSCTLSGPTEDVENYVKQLQEQKVFAKAVNVANIAYHSKHIAPAAPNLLARLKEVIPTPIKRSPIWVSTSVAESDWDKPLAQYCSAEYLTNNLLNCVMFEEGSKHIPPDALVIEIAPHGLLQAIMKRSLPETCSNVALTRRNAEGQNIENILSAIGEMYIHGLDVNVNALYPSIEYPVSRETPSIAQLARWHHSTADAGIFRVDLVGCHSGDPVTIQINNDSKYHYLKDHQINNQVILPTSFFMYLAWWVFSVLQAKTLDSHPVIFENVKLCKNVSISLAKPKKFAVFFQKGSGRFEIVKHIKSGHKKKLTEIMSGTLYQPSELTPTTVDETNLQNIKYTISSDQLYNVFKCAGYQLKGMFCSLEEMKYDKEDSYAKIRWCNNWVSFLDSLLKFNMFSEMKNKNDLLYTYKIRKLEISADQISSLENGSIIMCHRQHNTNITTCNGLKMYTVVNKRFSLSRCDIGLKCEGLRFVSHTNPRCQSVEEFLNLCLQIAVDNMNYYMSKKSRDDAKLNVIMVNNLSCFHTLKNIMKNRDALKTEVLFHDVELASLKKYVKNDECYMLIIDDLDMDIGKFVVDASFLLATSSNDSSMRLTKIEENFVLITKQQFLHKIFYLYRKKSFIEEDNVQIQNADWSKYDVPKRNESELTCIVKQSINSTDLSLMLNETMIPSDSRYLFVMDKNTPTESVLKSELTRDSSISVLQKGEWGSYRSISENRSKLEENPKNNADLPGDIQMDSVYLKYLGCDKEIEQSEDNKIWNCGIEYSGVQDTGERVMGLAVVNSNEPITKPDSILKWTPPNDWSLEDAATVPFIYTQAYYILDAPVIRGQQYLSSVLINVSDEGPFCEACISICLSRKYIVYVSVSSDEEADLIKKKFPQLDEKRIFNLEKCSFQAEILKLTNGFGVSLVVNCLPGIESIQESLNCAGDLSYCIQIGKTNDWESQLLELYPFLKALSFLMIPNKILKLLARLPDEEKQNLKSLVEDGIRSGIVVPFKSNVQIQGMSENNQFPKKDHIKTIFKWLRNSELCRNMNQKIRFDNNHSYIILGGEKKNYSWFELLEWLMSKGARKFIASVDNFFVGPNISHKINRLLNQKKATIILSSSRKTETLQDAETLVQDANKMAPLEAVFFASVESIGKKAHNMDLATRKLNPNIHLVSIFSGGLKECESRRFAGSPAVVFHGNRSTHKLSAVLPLIDDVLSQFDNSNSPTLYRFKNTENKTAESALRNYLPHDVNIFEKIADDLSDKLEFVEVTTKAPRYSNLKDCFPIFIISTLGPKPLKSLLSNLMSPAFCSSIGMSKFSIKESAAKLYESLNSIQSKAGVTLLSETWATPIAFELIKLLDQDKRKYRLFALEGNPLTWKDRIRSLGPMNSSQFENYLIAELFNIYPEIRLDTLLGVNKPLPEKISDYLYSQNYPSVNIVSISKVLESIQLGLEMMLKYEYNDECIKNTISLLQNPNENKPLRISVTSEMFIHEEENYQKFLSSYEVSKKINGNILYTLWYD
ncbi:fatty acid synthase-like [Planococcus citri]|uniref:fatty acid synthase-like n=1 Tax=Planococcus citri TaxID=170843 RepID=UPI0031F8FD81